MNPNAQRIALATAEGWTDCRIGSPGPGGAVNRTGRLIGRPPGRNYLVQIPNYLNDLNAMHEVEKILTRAQRVKFVEVLCGIVGVKWRPTSRFDSIHATAAQRAETLLRVLNLYKEEVVINPNLMPHA